MREPKRCTLVTYVVDRPLDFNIFGSKQWRVQRITHGATQVVAWVPDMDDAYRIADLLEECEGHACCT